MDKFQYLTSEPEDLLSIEIKGDRIKLVTISTDREEEIFQEFTTEITTYMFPDPARNLEERRAFINGSRQAIADGNNLQFVILSKSTS
jgi:[ribosomal protein S5]-alanine N-acetyltransferase